MSHQNVKHITSYQRIINFHKKVFFLSLGLFYKGTTVNDIAADDSFPLSMEPELNTGERLLYNKY